MRLKDPAWSDLASILCCQILPFFLFHWLFSSPTVFFDVFWTHQLYSSLTVFALAVSGAKNCLFLEFKKIIIPWLPFNSVQFSHSVVSDSCDPMNCSTPGLPVHRQLPAFTQTHVNRVRDAIQPSSSVVPFSSSPQSLPASESFPMSQLFAWGGQSTGASALASFLPKKYQG